MSEFELPQVSGFTLVRKGCHFDYPFEESIRSLLPYVDELVVNVGRSEDGTLSRVQALAERHSKIRLIESDWNLSPSNLQGGTVLAQETNHSFDQCRFDWCFYLQADEVLHEADLPFFQKSLKEAVQNNKVEGILFPYVHFYGSYDVIQTSRRVYRREVRVVKKSTGGRSVGDAQSFRKEGGEKLSVILTPARIFHYGWVRPPEVMKEKTFFMDQLYHGLPSAQQSKTGTPHTGDHYRYQRLYGLKRFQGTHPLVMKERILQKNWNWDFEKLPVQWSWKNFKNTLLGFFEKWTGHRFFEYRSYRLLKCWIGVGVACMMGGSWSWAVFPPALKKIEREYARRKAVWIEFKQSLWVELLKQEEESRGSLWIQKSKTGSLLFRWEVQFPNLQIFLNHENQFWSLMVPPQSLEIPEWVSQDKKDVQSDLLEQLLAGRFSSLEKNRWEGEGPNTFRFFLPKGLAGSVETLTLRVDPQKAQLSEVMLRHWGGNWVRLECQKTQFLKQLPASLFLKDSKASLVQKVQKILGKTTQPDHPQTQQKKNSPQ